MILNNSDKPNSFLEQYQKLLITKLELEIEAKKAPKKDKFAKADFWRYIFPASLQVLVITATGVILWKANVFDARNMLHRAEAIQIRNQTDSLNARKDSLSATILRQQELIISQADAVSATLDSARKLKTSMAVLTRANKNLVDQSEQIELNQIKRYVSNYLENVFSLYSPEIDNLIKYTRTKSKEYYFIRKLIDGEVFHDDTAKLHLQKVTKLAGLAQLCFGEKIYRDKFTQALKEYVKIQNREYSNYAVGFLNFLTYDKWGEANIEENIQIIVRYGVDSSNINKMSQLCSWICYRIASNGRKETFDYNYLDVIHNYIIDKFARFLNASPIFMKPAEKEFYNELAQAYFYECPQCYYALKYEVIQLHRKEILEIDKIGEMDSTTIPIKIKAWEYMEIPAIAKVGLLAVTNDPESLPKKFVIKNNKLIDKYTLPEFRPVNEVLLYYEQNKALLYPWLPNNIRGEINTPEIRRKIATNSF
jgi:hypothetical protein